MFQLVLSVFAISLIAALTVVSVNYLPGWGVAAQQTATLSQGGFGTLQNAFALRAQANGGSAPAVNTSRQDGGLAPAFQTYYSFLPRAPLGYGWTYGYTTQTQLTADGYGGDPTGGLYWFCLYPLSGGGSQAIYQGLTKARGQFPPTQFYLNINGPSYCGRAINTTAPGTFPSPVVATFFVRYVAGN